MATASLSPAPWFDSEEDFCFLQDWSHTGGKGTSLHVWTASKIWQKQRLKIMQDQKRKEKCKVKRWINKTRKRWKGGIWTQPPHFQTCSYFMNTLTCFISYQISYLPLTNKVPGWATTICNYFLKILYTIQAIGPSSLALTTLTSLKLPLHQQCGVTEWKCDLRLMLLTARLHLREGQKKDRGQNDSERAKARKGEIEKWTSK